MSGPRAITRGFAAGVVTATACNGAARWIVAGADCLGAGAAAGGDCAAGGSASAGCVDESTGCAGFQTGSLPASTPRGGAELTGRIASLITAGGGTSALCEAQLAVSTSMTAAATTRVLMAGILTRTGRPRPCALSPHSSGINPHGPADFNFPQSHAV